MGFAHFGAGMLLMKLFGLALTLGILFFIFWAYKALDKKALKKWALWLFVVGLVGLLLCSFLKGTEWGGEAFDKSKWKSCGCTEEVAE